MWYAAKGVGRVKVIVFLGVLFAILVILGIKGRWDAKRDKVRFRVRAKEQFGGSGDKEFATERFERVSGYFEKHRLDGQIDDITWNDLNMDEVFCRIDTSFSAAGEEYLYFLLRTPSFSLKELSAREEVARFFAENEDVRLDVQWILHRLGHTGKFSLYDYLDYLGDLEVPSKRVAVLIDLLYVPLIFLSAWQVMPWLVVLVVLLGFQIVRYFAEKERMQPYLISLSYVLRLVISCDQLANRLSELGGVLKLQIRQAVRELRPLSNQALWLIAGGSLGGAAVGNGNPLDLLLDYVRMLTHVDLVLFYRMLRFLRRHEEAVDVLLTCAGRIEAGIVIASYRASLGEGYCLPVFTEAQAERSVISTDNSEGSQTVGENEVDNSEGSQTVGENKANDSGCGQTVINKNGMVIRDGYHPLVADPVKNSIVAKKGVLLTGSNASGKSTFLKMAALQVLFAQTIHTCLASSYEAPMVHLLTSMSLRDNVREGDSYFMAEIKSLQRILRAAEGSSVPVYCMIDEVLRGTNTVERIAASEQILRSLTGEKILCFAATHDLELTTLLEGVYENYHFEEVIREGDIRFPYLLQKGAATTRNAILLLDILGYPEQMVHEASLRAQGYMKTGKWE
jgi:hypothetical protein